MTRVDAALRAEAILGFPVTARRRANETNRKKRFIIGSKEKNVVWWADSFENILKQLEVLDAAGELQKVRDYVRPSPVPADAVPTTETDAVPVLGAVEVMDAYLTNAAHKSRVRNMERPVIPDLDPPAEMPKPEKPKHTAFKKLLQGLRKK